jgi:peptidoglycan hydrolase-like protein with peptidoglycan-binding domain
VAGYPTIGQGATGADVVTLQQALALYGTYRGDLGGVYDADTAPAVQAFQASRGLAEDGVAGTDTWAQLVALGLVPPPDPVVGGLPRRRGGGARGAGSQPGQPVRTGRLALVQQLPGLFFGGSGGSVCPAGGGHDPTGSGDYVLKHM